MKRLFLPMALLCLGFSCLAWAGNDIYRYEEADGTIVYTNVPPTGSARRRVRRMALNPAPEKASPVRLTSRNLESARVYDSFIQSAAIRYRIPVPLVYAIMHAESAFDPYAISSVGASGLMQLMPATAKAMYVKDIFDPRENIEGGVRYLRVLANQFNGNMRQMVAAYNAGPEAVRKYGGRVPPYEETQAYVEKVLALYFQYKNKQLAQADEPKP